MKYLLFLLAGLFLFITSGCSGNNADLLAPDGPETDLDLPPAIDSWLTESLALFMGQSYSYEGMLYILVTYGEKPTGGYGVEIAEVTTGADRVKVNARFIEPGKDEMVTEAFTYPYDLTVIEDPGLPVEFTAEGAETYLPTLYGLNYLRPVAAGSNWIKVFAPAQGDKVDAVFSVEGIANVFEGTVNYKLTRAGETLAEGFATGMMGDWGYFSFDIDLTGQIESGDRVLLELFTLSPKDGSIEDLVEIELSIK
jgi:hypothetical protein